MKNIISVVGHTAFDHIFHVKQLPKPNSSAPIKDYQIFFGGGAANIAAGIAVMGGSSQLISPVGGDFRGSEYQRYLEALGVDMGMIYYIEDEKTASAFVYTDDNHDQVTYFYWGASGRFPQLDPPEVKLLHLATGDPIYNCRAAQKGKFVSFDPGQDLIIYSKEHLETILACTDILFTNRHEIERLSQITGRTRGDLEKEIGVVVVTLDRGGSEIFVNGERIFIPAVEVNAVDPTGAGDAYRAGFLVAYVKGHPPEMCGRIGSTAASFIVEKAGCQTNLPTWDQIMERFNNYYKE